MKTPYSLPLLLLVSVYIVACSPQQASEKPTQKTLNSTQQNFQISSQMAIAIPEEYAAAAVEQVLRDGGNAIDASVTAAFALAVTFPEAGNIGGGGFLLTRMNNELHFLDYREKAPLTAHRDMYLDAQGNVIENSSLIGIRAAGVPGTVDGIWQAHKKFGTKPWAELIAPAIALAENGFKVHPKKAARIAPMDKWFDGKVNFMQYFGAMQNAELFKQPELAVVLSRIAELGPDDFYKGQTAKLIVAQMQREGGLISMQDLADYSSVWRAPLVAQWRDYTIVSAPPPSSGGFAVIQLLKMKEHLDEKFKDVEHNSADYVHLVAEMSKRVFADRAEYFGDPDFIDVPMVKLVSDQYIQRRADEVNSNQISTLEQVQPGLESPNTTHFSIVDRWGNAVSNTYTLNWEFGSGTVVEGAGFILNNEMDDFSIKPGTLNAYGVVGGSANEIKPSKRMLSSMSPTLLLKGEQLEMVVGTPGGSTIFTSVFQAIANIIDFDMTAEQAVSASRFHHQLLPPELVTHSISIPLSDTTKQSLAARGYRVEPHAWEFGDLQVIARKEGQLSAASDPRGVGVSKVFE